MDTVSKLNTLAEQMRNNFSDMNYGGCGVVAAIVGTKLAQVGIPTTIRVADYGRNSLSRLRSIIHQSVKNRRLPTKREWNNAGMSFTHVIIEFDIDGKHYHFDANGCVEASDVDPTFSVNIMEGSLSLSEARKVARDESWNSCFDRDQIPQMRKMVNRFFKANFA